MNGCVPWPTRKSELCQETVWSHLAPDGSWAPGHLAPCTSPARWAATVPSDGNRVTLLCGRHANTGRWAGYPDIVWRALDAPQPEQTHVG